MFAEKNLTDFQVGARNYAQVCGFSRLPTVRSECSFGDIVVKFPHDSVSIIVKNVAAAEHGMIEFVLQPGTPFEVFRAIIDALVPLVPKNRA